MLAIQKSGRHENVYEDDVEQECHLLFDGASFATRSIELNLVF